MVKFTKHTKYIGQTSINGGILFHYVDPKFKGQYPTVESIFMPVLPAESGATTES